MTLRERKKPASTEPSPAPSPSKSKSAKTTKPLAGATNVVADKDREGTVRDLHGDPTEGKGASSDAEHKTEVRAEEAVAAAKKLPRVILRLGPAPDKVS